MFESWIEQFVYAALISILILYQNRVSLSANREMKQDQPLI